MRSFCKTNIGRNVTRIPRFSWGNIAEGAKRMKALFSDLLAYAEIGAISDDSGEVVDLNLVLPVLCAAHKFPFVTKCSVTSKNR
jgi:hypothetical protein